MSAPRTPATPLAREHPIDVQVLSQYVNVVQDRWWVDAMGNFGLEGGGMLGNLFAAAKQRGGGRGGYHRATAGGYIGADGSTSYFFAPKSGASVMTGP